MDQIKIIMVTDQSILQSELIHRLESAEIKFISIVSSFDKAIESCLTFTPDLLIIDTDINGFADCMESIKKLKIICNIPCLFIYNELTEDLLKEIFQIGTYGFLNKPIIFDRFLLSIRHAMYLWNREKRLKDIINTLPDIVYEIDEEGTISFVSENVYRIFGYRKDELKSVQDVFKLFIPEDQKRAADNYLKTASGLPGKEVEYTVVTKNGNNIPISIIANPIIEGNICKGTRGVIRDISERKNEQRKLFESEERYRTLVENINDVHAILDIKGFITYVSPSVERLSGYTPAEIIGKNFSGFVYPEDIPDVLDRF